MLTYLGQLAGDVPVFNVFRYITFRTGAATMTALLFVFLFGPGIIQALRLKQEARASRSAPTARRRISPRPARRPWAG